MVTPIAIRIKMTLSRKMFTTRKTEYPIVNHKIESVIPLKIKVFTLSILWLTIGYSVFFVVDIYLYRVVLILIAIGVTIHVLSIRTLKQ